MEAVEVFRIGCGAGFSADRLDPAVDLAERGALDALVFECLGERTLAFAHRDRRAGASSGHDPWLERRMRAVLPPCARAGTRVITNMGAADPAGAAARTAEIARALALDGLTIAAVAGDDVTDLVDRDTPLWEGMTIAEVGKPLIAANAYLGADALRPALEADADVVVTGRVADPALFLAPLRHRFGWNESDWARLGAGTLVGHLLECAGQATGGYFADPGVKDVAGLDRLGFPLAEVSPEGSAIVTKLEGTGGEVSPRTVKEQLLYEVHDPAHYLTPDVAADFSAVTVEEEGPDRVRVAGASGRERPEKLKVTVAFDGGFLAEAGVSYAGLGAADRARLAGDTVESRLRSVHGITVPVRVDLIGIASLHSTVRGRAGDARDVRLHCALRSDEREEARCLLWEVESLLTNGPAGGGGYRGSVTPSVLTYSASIPRARTSPTLELVRT